MIWYFVAAFVDLLIWAAVLLVPLPLWAGIVPTLLIVGALVALFVLKRIKAAKAAREIESALNAQADAHAKTARPDLQPEIQEMQAEFAKAVGSLKSSKLARGGRDALSVLPWYLIIGPPGAGKSTALRNSGLQFPYLSSRGGGVKGVGGTRNCEWWLTNEAVILDTAGRYSTEDDDREEWFAFLSSLTKNRSKKPVNGLLVAVSIGDLADADEEAAVRLGQTLRERVDEVMARLKMIVPVYLVLTKCDLIAGFVEMFGDLRKAERGQIWGFTVPSAEKLGSPGDLLSQRFDELGEVLEQRALYRLGQERRLEARERIYQFPQQFVGLKSVLTEFVQTLFAENVYQDTPVLRGVYLTSGTQEGRPIDRVMRSMADAFGIRPLLPSATEPVTDAKSYFLRDVFSEVIFPDQNLAVRSTRESRRQVLQQYAYAAGALAFALAVMLFPTVSFFKNRDLVQSTRELVQQVKGSGAASGGPAAVAKLSPLRQRLDELYQYKVNGPPLGMRFGMYPGDDLFTSVRAFYGTAVRKTLIDPLIEQDIEDMEGFARRYEASGRIPGDVEHIRFYDRLKLQLLVSGPKPLAEPPLSEALQGWLAQHIAARWGRKLGSAVSSESLRDMESHVKVYAKLLATDPSLLVSRSDSTVRRTRAALLRFPVGSLALEQLVSTPKLEEYDLTLTLLLGGTTPELFSDGKVRGAFTQKGWEDLIRPHLNSDALAEESWVVGRKSGKSESGDGADLLRLLRSQYFRRYILEWKGFLESIRVSQPATSTEALGMLEDLTRGDPPPFGRLFRALGYNVRLRDSDVEDAVSNLGGDALDKLKNRLAAAQERAKGAAAGAGVDIADPVDESGQAPLGAKDVEKTFAGLIRFGVPAPQKDKSAAPGSVPLDVYQEQLAFLRDAVRADLDNPDDHGPLVARLQTARVRVASLIDSQEIGWRPRLQALFWPPIESLSRSSTSDMAAATSQKWCSAVVTAFDRSLANRYPFNPNGHDAALADVADFYRPAQGTLWAFYGQALQTDMPREGSQYRFAGRLKSAGGIYSSQILTFLNRANEISTALFPPGSPELSTQFSIHIQPSPKLAAISFTVDGQTVDYRNGPEEWHTLRWPGQGKTLGAAVRVRTNKGVTEAIEQEGEWGLFRVLEAGSTKANPNARVFTTTWKIQALDVEVSIDIRPARSETPFFGVPRPGEMLHLMHPFRAAGVFPPRSIGKGSAHCAG